MMKKISIIVPVYNESKNISLIVDAIDEIKRDIEYFLDIIFVDDGSDDDSINNIERFVNDRDDISLIELSRNFGKEKAITAGINESNSDAVIMVDADLQHPIDLIPQFIKKWENGADIVVGVRKDNHSSSFISSMGSVLFYKIMNAISNQYTVPYSTDFRLLDKKVINEFKKLTERNRVTRTLIDWLGFKKDYIYFSANKRIHGKGSYNFIKKFNSAMVGFIGNSLLPLKLASYIGITITIISGFIGMIIFINKYFLDDTLGWNVTGSASLAILLIFLVGIILFSLGVIALYIANIHDEISKRPVYVIRNIKKSKRKRTEKYNKERQ